MEPTDQTRQHCSGDVAPELSPAVPADEEAAE
jgi:hypothetical protein